MDGTVTPDDEDAWIVELGRRPFAYYVNQRNADNNYGMPIDRKLLADATVLAFLPSSDGDLAKTFKQRGLILRQWASNGS